MTLCCCSSTSTLTITMTSALWMTTMSSDWFCTCIILWFNIFNILLCSYWYSTWFSTSFVFPWWFTCCAKKLFPWFRLQFWLDFGIPSDTKYHICHIVQTSLQMVMFQHWLIQCIPSHMYHKESQQLWELHLIFCGCSKRMS